MKKRLYFMALKVTPPCPAPPVPSTVAPSAPALPPLCTLGDLTPDGHTHHWNHMFLPLYLTFTSTQASLLPAPPGSQPPTPALWPNIPVLIPQLPPGKPTVLDSDILV